MFFEQKPEMSLEQAEGISVSLIFYFPDLKLGNMIVAEKQNGKKTRLSMMK
ncbi:hypothetical protein CRH01_32620 [Chryseobacterium rhizosphaerae]|nr:hypothetical protein CRH01_32620 [Chryseobacterium rhizosphaerae]